MSSSTLIYVAIALGSGLGGVTRYWCYGVTLRFLGPLFPFGTLVVNVIGSSFIGFFATLSGPEGRLLVPAHIRQFVMVGFCGGYTTFSTFSLETLYLIRDGQWAKATANIAASLCLCLIGAWMGHLAATALNER
jgi:fluoride exporter